MQCTPQQQKAIRSWKKNGGKKKNCQTVRTIYGSRKKNCKEKRCQPNVGKFNVTTMGMGRARGSGRGNRAGGNMCVPLVAWTAAAAAAVAVAHMCAQCVGLLVLTCHRHPCTPNPPRPIRPFCALLINHTVHLSRYILFLLSAAAAHCSWHTKWKQKSANCTIK